ncbi:ACT domain-containing protein [Pelosinus sp. UFO1]|uniref:ACT domain-containing protein n=1 Tax=Pelosinus sp. UFO1 TaxID=484770 RepID=UPI0004D1D394|nr:ACT domain-containing protein [Pelosinus sp. UFO1]AIF53822.1 amino acid-binding ACT domain-containing protein [Pelosinus sp. UFO1]
MIIQQISVFLENRTGTLAEVLATLHENNINIRAMSVAETADFGILRFIVNQPDKVEQVLRKAQFALRVTPVLTMVLDDSPGSLLGRIEKLSSAGINIEYFYAFAVVGTERARIVLKVDALKEAEQLLGEYEEGQHREKEQETDFYW